MIAALVVAVAAFLAALWLLDRRASADAGKRVAAYLATPRPTAPAIEEERQQSRSKRSLARTERVVGRLPGWASFDELVARADPRFSALELFWGGLLLGLLVVVVAAAIGVSSLGVVALVVLEPAVVRLWLALLVRRRGRAFDEQLPEYLTDVGGALRVGHGLNQALQAVTAEAPEPTAKEFGRVLAEARLGRPLEEALTDLGTRIRSDDLQFVIDAVIVQRQVGGSLAGVFEIVADSVRQRQQFALKVRALTSMGRMSALVVLLLPAGMAAILSLVNHHYFSPLVHSQDGPFVVGAAVFMLGFGCLWLRGLVGPGRT